MVLPALILYLLVLGFPIVISIILSLSNYNGGKMFGGEPWRIVGFQQYQRLVHDPYFWSALKNNIYIVLVSVFGQLPLGFIFAYLIYRRVVRFGEFWQAVLYMPAIISVIVIGIMWSIIFSPSGVIAEIVNRANANALYHKISHVFNAAGGFNITDTVVKQLIAISGPVAGQTFQNPMVELKAPHPDLQPRQAGRPGARPGEPAWHQVDPHLPHEAGRGHAPHPVCRALVLDGDVHDPLPCQHAEDRHRGHRGGAD